MDRLAQAARRGLGRIAFHLAVAGWMTLVAVYATWPLAAQAGTQVAGNLGDPLEIAWRLAWGAHAVVHQPLHLFNANMLSPEQGTLALSENHLGVSLPLAPIFWVSDNALLLLNVEIILVLAAAGLAIYLLVWELTRERAAAIVAGTAYVGVGFRISSVNLGHVHSLAVHLIPLVLLLLLRMRRDRSWRTIAGLALLVGWQWWSALTGGLQTLIAVGTWGLWELIRFRRQAWPELWRAGVGVGLGLLLALPILWPYVEFRRSHPDFSHDVKETIELSATPGSYLSPAPVGRAVGGLYRTLSDRFRDAHGPTEKELFPGLWLSGAFLTAGAGAAVAAVRHRRSQPRTPRAVPPGIWSPAEAAGLFGAITAVAFVLSLGPRLGASSDGPPLPFTILTELIPGNLMRVPARIGALALLGMTVVTGMALARTPRQLRRWLVGISFALLALEFLPPRIDLVRPPEITRVHRAIADRPGAVLALPTVEFSADGGLIYDFGAIVRETQQLYLSTANFRPLVNGYGYLAPVYLEVARAAADLPSPASLAALDRHGVRTVILDHRLTAGTRWAELDSKLRNTPGVREIASTSAASAFDVSPEPP